MGRQNALIYRKKLYDVLKKNQIDLSKVREGRLWKEVGSYPLTQFYAKNGLEIQQPLTFCSCWIVPQEKAGLILHQKVSKAILALLYRVTKKTLMTCGITSKTEPDVIPLLHKSFLKCVQGYLLVRQLLEKTAILLMRVNWTKSTTLY